MLLRRHLLVGAAALNAQPKQIAPLGKAGAFYYGDEWDKPFLYPLRTVSGRVLSRRYPSKRFRAKSMTTSGIAASGMATVSLTAMIFGANSAATKPPA